MPGDAGLRALLARVEAATRPHHEIDTLIELELTVPDYRQHKYPKWAVDRGLSPSMMWGCLRYDSGGVPHPVPAYTWSLDAAVALVERCLPDFEWLVRNDDLRFAFANVHTKGRSPNEDHPCWPAYGATPALALCAALLRALAAQGDRDGAAGGEGTGDV